MRVFLLVLALCLAGCRVAASKHTPTIRGIWLAKSDSVEWWVRVTGYNANHDVIVVFVIDDAMLDSWQPRSGQMSGRFTFPYLELETDDDMTVDGRMASCGISGVMAEDEFSVEAVAWCDVPHFELGSRLHGDESESRMPEFRRKPVFSRGMTFRAVDQPRDTI